MRIIALCQIERSAKSSWRHLQVWGMMSAVELWVQKTSKRRDAYRTKLHDIANTEQLEDGELDVVWEVAHF